MNIEREFTEIYNTHSSKVYRLCLGYASGDENLAKEWQQETFIKVWKHRKSFKEESSIGTWIYRIAVNICMGDLRKSKKHIPISEEILASNTADTDEIKHDDKIEKMYNCINRLSKNNKILILMELEEVPQATIAETIGIAYGTLRTRLSRIRNALLKCITDEK